MKFVALALFFYATLVQASERTQVCAKFETQYGWSKGYQVEATVLDGFELNQATTSLSYNSIAKYVVIFWKPGEASIIEMDFPLLSVISTNGKDRQGRKWQIAQTDICF